MLLLRQTMILKNSQDLRNRITGFFNLLKECINHRLPECHSPSWHINNNNNNSNLFKPFLISKKEIPLLKYVTVKVQVISNPCSRKLVLLFPNRLKINQTKWTSQVFWRWKGQRTPFKFVLRIVYFSYPYEH